MKNLLLLLFFPALTIFAQTSGNPQTGVVPSSANAATVLEAARNLNGLDGKDLKPWHLKAHFESFGEKGALVSHGTFEEWWIAPDRYKRSYISANFTQTEYRSPEGFFTTGANGLVPWPISLISDHVLAPLPSANEITESLPEKRKQDFGGVRLECVMLSQKIAGAGEMPLGLFPTYCFSLDKPVLRLSNYYGGVQSIFNRMGLFQQRYLGLDTTLKNGADDLLHLQVDQLTLLPDAAVLQDIQPPSGAVKHSMERADLTADALAGRKIAGLNPIYPLRAKQNRVSGKVEISALISTDGHIRNLRVVKAPDSDLALASIAAVQRWVYKPYLLNGEPVEVNTTIQVNFTLGP